MSITPIKTIFWDIGGVLLANGWDRNQRYRVLTSLGVNVPAYEAVHDEVNYFWERGLMTAQDFFAKTVIDTNLDLHLTFEKLWPLVCSESRILHQGSFDILAALKSSGQYHLATINNESKELNAYRLDTFGLRQYFNYFICSGYVHEMKPLPDIYRAAIDISGLPPETALFIDDKQENCEAARAFGMNAIHFESPAQLRASLTQHGIAV
ncbi:HAD family hydrolase [Edaphobacter dinghuensis]|uniref:Hydrolase n=1 Tax=Edaphobacter dinghuensis TaxID=1560005 RepID=A0A917H0M9_9BACT|nr:HAD family phosphatase [Edaphobacter dinghuensis]GGG63638.1 hydrolase [Edaphobacter dinghuensis]